MGMGPDGSYEYTGLTQKMHDFYAFSMSIFFFMRPTYDTGHCLVWWPGASFGARRLVGTHVFVGRSQKKKKEKREGAFTVDSGTGRFHDNTGLT